MRLRPRARKGCVLNEVGNVTHGSEVDFLKISMNWGWKRKSILVFLKGVTGKGEFGSTDCNGYHSRRDRKRPGLVENWKGGMFPARSKNFKSLIIKIEHSFTVTGTKL